MTTRMWTMTTPTTRTWTTMRMVTKRRRSGWPPQLSTVQSRPFPVWRDSFAERLRKWRTTRKKKKKKEREKKEKRGRRMSVAGGTAPAKDRSDSSSLSFSSLFLHSLPGNQVPRGHAARIPSAMSSPSGHRLCLGRGFCTCPFAKCAGNSKRR